MYKATVAYQESGQVCRIFECGTLLLLSEWLDAALQEVRLLPGSLDLFPITLSALSDALTGTPILVVQKYDNKAELCELTVTEEGGK